MSPNVVIGIQTADAATVWVASFAHLKASTVQFEATRANAVASMFSWIHLVMQGAIASISERPRIASKNGLDGLHA